MRLFDNVDEALLESLKGRTITFATGDMDKETTLARGTILKVFALKDNRLLVQFDCTERAVGCLKYADEAEWYEPEGLMAAPFQFLNAAHGIEDDGTILFITPTASRGIAHIAPAPAAASIAA